MSGAHWLIGGKRLSNYCLTMSDLLLSEKIEKKGRGLQATVVNDSL
jgi:hypothetical protein